MTLLTMTRGDTRVFRVTLTDADGAPLNLTGLTLKFTAKRRTSDADDDAVIAKASSAGITLVDGPNGIADITILPADTDSYSDTAPLLWDVQVENGATDIRTPLSGWLIVAGDVTRTVG